MLAYFCILVCNMSKRPDRLRKKVLQLTTNLPPKRALQLVQQSFANRYLMNTILGAAGAVAVVMGRDRRPLIRVH